MKKIVVVGGTNIDIYAKSKNNILKNDSNPGSIKYSFGGVGNNIALNLKKLDLDIAFITAIGKDSFGENYLSFAKKNSLEVYFKEVDITPTYIAILDDENDLELAIAAMDSLENLDVVFLERQHKLLELADIIVIDTNVSEEVIKFIFKNYKAKIYADAVSTFKVNKLKPYLHKIHTLKLNIKEAITLSNLDKTSSISTISSYFSQYNIPNIFITDGKNGAYHIKENNITHFQYAHKNIISTQGAGDAFLAGIIYANIYNLNPLHIGTVMAIMTLESEKTISEKLSKDYLKEKCREVLNNE